MENSGKAEDFGDKTDIPTLHSVNELEKSPEVPCNESPVTPPASPNGAYTCWSSYGKNEWLASPAPANKLTAGIYAAGYLSSISRYCFMKRDDPVTDSAIEFQDSQFSEVLCEINNFWKQEEIYSRYGFLHRRGYMLYGPAGTGKSILLAQIIRRAIKNDYIVLSCDGKPHAIINALADFRQVEPNRKIICVFEDIDAIIRSWGEAEILSLLDGSCEINHVLNLATTNYPEKLDRRIIARPRRFDRLIKVGHPDANVRRQFFQIKLASICPNDVETWVKYSDGLSLAALSEMVISVVCHNKTPEAAANALKGLMSAKASSDDYDTTSIGFGGGK